MLKASSPSPSVTYLASLLFASYIKDNHVLFPSKTSLEESFQMLKSL